MFNTVYRCPRTIARHENGPLAESRRRYLEHLSAQGAAFHTIRAAAGVIYRVTIMMKLDESGPVERRDVERADKRRENRGQTEGKTGDGKPGTDGTFPYFLIYDPRLRAGEFMDPSARKRRGPQDDKV